MRPGGGWRWRGDEEIRERLARSEPDRADYQRHLAVTPQFVAAGDPDGQHLLRAAAILAALKESGRLDPADEPMLAALARALIA